MATLHASVRFRESAESTIDLNTRYCTAFITTLRSTYLVRCKANADPLVTSVCTDDQEGQAAKLKAKLEAKLKAKP